MGCPAAITVVDHYDSFTYNLVALLAKLGAVCQVVQHDQISVEGVMRTKPDGIILSPGPGHPAQAHLALSLLRAHGQELPFLGVCLGHQVLGLSHGATIRAARQILHGKASPILHRGASLFRGLPNGFLAARYNSLAVAPEALPACLEVTAVDPTGEIMGLCHQKLPLHGIQFHPESILSECGTELARNWLEAL